MFIFSIHDVKTHKLRARSLTYGSWKADKANKWRIWPGLCLKNYTVVRKIQLACFLKSFKLQIESLEKGLVYFILSKSDKQGLFFFPTGRVKKHPSQKMDQSFPSNLRSSFEDGQRIQTSDLALCTSLVCVCKEHG